jgi:hypothetical protein
MANFTAVGFIALNLLAEPNWPNVRAVLYEIEDSYLKSVGFNITVKTFESSMLRVPLELT